MKIRFKPDRVSILKLLKTSNISRKLRILDRLGELNDRDRIKILLKVLEDSSWTLRERAAQQLATFGKRVLPRLKKLSVRGYWYTRAAACRALGEIGDVKALPEITTLIMNDVNPTVVQEASQALVAIVRRHPEEFCTFLTNMEFDEEEMNKIERVLESIDVDLFNEIRERLGNE
jgi:HEAT repeat protein